MTYQIRPKYFNYNRVAYFRGNAESIQIGDVGHKRTPALKANYLDVARTLPSYALNSVQLRTSPAVDIDWNRVTEGSLNVGLKFIRNSGGSASLTKQNAQRYNLKMVKVDIFTEDARNLINRHALNIFRSSKQARIVTSVWIVLEGNIAQQLASKSGIKANATVNGLEVSVSVGYGNTTNAKIILGRNTTFAYSLHAVRSWARRKSSVEQLRPDQFGSG